MKDGYRVIDADGHIIEPSRLWYDYIAPEFRDRALRLEDWAFGVYLGLDRISPDSKRCILWDNAIDLYGATDVA